ncbi:hypothetical protein E4H12_13240 [Candidatus Thorarchaeota archaeon]|nr:MAG: hypothetical protein E4H12_13240 [Candidatus Thorarchaeota archaeon]
MNHIILSKGNIKGKVVNVSLRPVEDCGNCEYCKDKCYAKKVYKLRPVVRYAWDNNSDAFNADPFGACESIIEQLYISKPIKLFRIHVSGDFLNQEHLDSWNIVADQFPQTKFLAFTKMFDLDYSAIKKNIQIVYSMWPGMPDDNVPDGPRAWVQDGTETRMPDNAIECDGQCHQCAKCWNLRTRDIVFKIH